MRARHRCNLHCCSFDRSGRVTSRTRARQEPSRQGHKPVKRQAFEVPVVIPTRTLPPLGLCSEPMLGHASPHRSQRSEGGNNVIRFRLATRIHLVDPFRLRLASFSCLLCRLTVHCFLQLRRLHPHAHCKSYDRAPWGVIGASLGRSS